MSLAKKASDRNVEGILHYLQDYISIRVQHAIRVNPRIASMIDDIVWAQMENLRQVLEKPKSFGPERVRVADILACDNELRRKALFSHSDQNSVIFEIVDKADDQKRAMSEMAVHNMRTFYRALDPSLEMIVELIQHWILWDLPDASLLHNFDEYVRRIDALTSMEITEELRGRYRAALQKKPEDPLSDTDILQFEAKRMEHWVQAFLQRRNEEEAYQSIIRRDSKVHSETTEAILKLAHSIRAAERLEAETGELDHEAAEKYASILRRPVTTVTREFALDYERKAITEEKRLLAQIIGDDCSLGEPYDYKKSQAEGLRERLAAEMAKIQGRITAPAVVMTAPPA